MRILINIEEIDRQQWEQLIAESPTATWFQTPEAYDFFASLPNILTPFVIACRDDAVHRLKGVIVGYITKDKNPIRQFFTRRAIIMGGPLLSDDITDAELQALLCAMRKHIGQKAIYVETRNFNDYSRWKDIFQACGFSYQPHLNFHIDTSSIEIINQNLNRNRKRNIRTIQQTGATIVEHPTIAQIHDFYTLLQQLYKKKIHLPLVPFAFFENLSKLYSAVFRLVELNGEIIGGTAHVALANRTLYEWYGCGEDSEQANESPTSFVTYAGMCYAALHGMPRFDMMGAGKPTEGYGVRDFKRQFGGTLVEHGRFLHICHSLLYSLGTLGVRILKYL